MKTYGILLIVCLTISVGLGMIGYGAFQITNKPSIDNPNYFIIGGIIFCLTAILLPIWLSEEEKLPVGFPKEIV
jgi:hypothetical protein